MLDFPSFVVLIPTSTYFIIKQLPSTFLIQNENYFDKSLYVYFVTFSYMVGNNMGTNLPIVFS